MAPNPHWVAFSPDGTFAYTANHESDLITVLDVASDLTGQSPSLAILDAGTGAIDVYVPASPPPLDAGTGAIDV